MTSRRRFLAAFAAACALDPERLLYVPGKKHISVPSGRVFLPDEVYGAGMDGDYVVVGLSERFWHLKRVDDGVERSWARDSAGMDNWLRTQ